MTIWLITFWPELAAVLAVNGILGIGYFCFGMEPGDIYK